MAKKAINKIIYFDKETIRNILQERDHGELSRVTDISSAAQVQTSITTEASAKLKLEVPLVHEFLFCLPVKLMRLMLSKETAQQLYHQRKFLNSKN